MAMPGAPAVPDRRQAQRIVVRLPVELENGKGITRDVSAGGVFFLTDLSFSIGEPINFRLVLERADPVGPLRVRCQGRVVRLERCDSARGVAVSIASHHLELAEHSDDSY
jgi:PilZ domain